MTLSKLCTVYDGIRSPRSEAETITQDHATRARFMRLKVVKIN
jgi:hypothetical protein